MLLRPIVFYAVRWGRGVEAQVDVFTEEPPCGVRKGPIATAVYSHNITPTSGHENVPDTELPSGVSCGANWQLLWHGDCNTGSWCVLKRRGQSDIS